MRKIALLSAGVGAMLAAMLPAIPAHAQFWVASNGNDAAACQQNSPCASFQRAHDAAFPGAVIKCLDSLDTATGGKISNVIISKSITIDCTGTNSTIWGGNAPAVSFSTGGNVVTLRGLAIDTLGGNLGQFGIDLTNTNELHVENCRIANWRTIFNPTASGIRVVAGLAFGGSTALYVSDTLIENNGNPSAGGGISIQAAGTGGQFLLSAARVVLNRVQFVKNTHGVVADGTSGKGSIIVQVRDSIVTRSAGNGIAALSQTGTASAGIVVDRTSLIDNAGSGILAQGSGALVHLGNSTVAGNGAGLNPTSGGTISSYQNNQVGGNLFDGAPNGSPPLTLK
jgi:hypothetical protein